MARVPASVPVHVIAALYLAEAPRPAEHHRALRALLQLSPPAARQLAHL